MHITHSPLSSTLLLATVREVITTAAGALRRRLGYTLPVMTIDQIVAQLKAERTRLDHAIAALDSSSSVSSTPTRRGRGSGKMSAAGRARISAMMKARWAARRAGKKK